MTENELVRRVEMLETIVLKMQETLAKLNDGVASSSPVVPDAFPDHMLERPWADKTITRDPKYWDVEKHGSFVGKTYSQAPLDWLERMASLLDYKVQQEKKKEAPNLKQNGRPFYEDDIFNAKLLRAWARRKAKNASKINWLDAPSEGGLF